MPYSEYSQAVVNHLRDLGLEFALPVSVEGALGIHAEEFEEWRRLYVKYCGTRYTLRQSMGHLRYLSRKTAEASEAYDHLVGQIDLDTTSMQVEIDDVKTALAAKQSELANARKIYAKAAEGKAKVDALKTRCLSQRRQQWYVPNTGEGSSKLFEILSDASLLESAVDASGGLMNKSLIGPKLLGSTASIMNMRNISVEVLTKIASGEEAPFDVDLAPGVVMLVLRPTIELMDMFLEKARTARCFDLNPILVVGYGPDVDGDFSEKLESLEAYAQAVIHVPDTQPGVSIRGVATTLESRLSTLIARELTAVTTEYRAAQNHMRTVEAAVTKLERKLANCTAALAREEASFRTQTEGAAAKASEWSDRLAFYQEHEIDILRAKLDRLHPVMVRAATRVLASDTANVPASAAAARRGDLSAALAWLVAGDEMLAVQAGGAGALNGDPDEPSSAAPA